jgi:6-phosphofructokinase 2
MRRIVTVTLNPALDVSTETAEVAPGRKLRCAAPMVEAGGGGVNVARAVAYLGGTALPLVAAGGSNGARLMALLRAEGLEPVDLGLPLETRESFSVLETGSGRQFRFVLPGPEWTAAHCKTARAVILGACQAGDLLVVSGSRPQGVPDDYFVALARAAATLGAETVLDTSDGPLAAAAAAGADLATLRMDGEEAESLAGRPLTEPGDFAALASALVARGAARIVAIGAGALGTLVADRARRALCRAPRVPVVSKIGAGDSFTAAFALRLAAGESAVEACVWGVAAASAAVMTPGTRLFDRETLQRLRPLVAVEPL